MDNVGDMPIDIYQDYLLEVYDIDFPWYCLYPAIPNLYNNFSEDFSNAAGYGNGYFHSFVNGNGDGYGYGECDGEGECDGDGSRSFYECCEILKKSMNNSLQKTQ